MRGARAVAFLPWLALAWAGCGPAPAVPWRVYWWYAERPTDAEASALREMGAERLYVRVAEVRREGGGVAIDRVPGTPFPVEGLQVVPLVRVGHDVVIEGEVPWEDVGAALSAIRGQLPPGELHVDFDCPTSRIERYASLLAELRADGRGPVSTTALLAWAEEGKLPALAAHTEVVLLAYGGRLPTSPGAPHDIAEMDRLRRIAPSLAAAGFRVVVGLPCYGEGWVWHDGRREQYLTGLDVDELTESDAAVLDAAPTPAAGSLGATATFRLDEGMLLGGVLIPSGRRVQLVTPRMAALRTAVAELPGLLRGSLAAVAWHRATRGEAGGLGLAELSAIRSRPVAPVELATRRKGGEVVLALRMPPSRRGDLPSSAQVDVSWDGVGATCGATFDDLAFHGTVGGRRAPSSPRRATGLHLDEAYLAPGEEVEARIALAEGNGRVRLEASLALDGRTVRLDVDVPEGESRRELP